MSSPPLTSENSAIVMIDHAVAFGNVFRYQDLPRWPGWSGWT